MTPTLPQKTIHFAMVPTMVAQGLIRFYQMTISQVTPSSCRFVPTCSEYAFDAIGKYGLLRGVWLGTRRLARCHPFNAGGYDPVP